MAPQSIRVILALCCRAMTSSREASALNWIFTLNNWTKEEYDAIVAYDCNYHIIGKETGERGTPHLQGYIQFKRKVRLPALKKINSRAHWEKARGSAKENKAYCSKDGDYVEKGVMSEERKRKLDTVKAVNQIMQGVSPRQLMEEHGAGYIFNADKLDKMVKRIQDHDKLQLLHEEFKNVELREWQKEVWEKLQNQDSRKILFVVDFVGNTGKTYLSKWLVLKQGAMRFENARSIDIKEGYQGQQYVIFDIPRSSQEHINYAAMECIKNGAMFSSKYHSCMKMYTHSKIVVFTNRLPDMGGLSKDRYDIMQL